MHLSEGTHFMRVCQLLGHATYRLTLDTYGDSIPAEQYADKLPEPPAPAKPSNLPANVVNFVWAEGELVLRQLTQSYAPVIHEL